jgi:DNA-binding LacI/PurR family transcriptional regulator
MIERTTPVPDGVYCLTERHAAGLLDAFQEAGLRTPDDVMVVAGSDSEQTHNSSPPIESVDLEPELVARTALKLFVRRLEQDENSGPSLIQSALLIRASNSTAEPS